MENISIVMVQLMKDNEIKINSMVKAKNYGQMVLSILDNIMKEKNKVMENFYGLMVVLI